MSRFGSFVEELLEEGRAEGRAEADKQLAKSMQAKGFTPTQIAEILDMTENEVKYYIDTYSK